MEGVQAQQTAPVAPAKPGVEGGNSQITVSWVAPNNGGAAISGYEYVKKVGSNPFETNWTPIANSANLTSYTVTGLTNGTVLPLQGAGGEQRWQRCGITRVRTHGAWPLQPHGASA